MGSRPGPLPNRWLYCPRKSDSFIADKFLAFKTPLSERFDIQMPDDCQFHPDMIFKLMKMYKVSFSSSLFVASSEFHNYFLLLD